MCVCVCEYKLCYLRIDSNLHKSRGTNLQFMGAINATIFGRYRYIRCSCACYNKIAFPLYLPPLTPLPLLSRFLHILSHTFTRWIEHFTCKTCLIS